MFCDADCRGKIVPPRILRYGCFSVISQRDAYTTLLDIPIQFHYGKSAPKQPGCAALECFLIILIFFSIDTMLAKQMNAILDHVH